MQYWAVTLLLAFTASAMASRVGGVGPAPDTDDGPGLEYTDCSFSGEFCWCKNNSGQSIIVDSSW
ncbi:hypothetical protein Cpir12675_006997, partial [Ceratocystis pirilliformis]